MASFSSSLARNALFIGRLTRRIPTATSATLQSWFVPRICSATANRGLKISYHISKKDRSPKESPTTTTTDTKKQTKEDFLTESLRNQLLTDEDWRQPRLEFSDHDYTRLLYLRVPLTATIKDVRELISRAGLQSAQVFMYHSLETGKPKNRCFIKLADENEIEAAITTLSQFTLLGTGLEPKRFDSEKKLITVEEGLLDGWLPSSSSKLADRKPRGPVTEPPQIVPLLLSGRWVQFQKLPSVGRDHQVPLLYVLSSLYEQFHQYDVLAVTAPYPHLTKTNGWVCKMLFADRNDAKAAVKMHRNQATFMGSVPRAKTFRGGPNIHANLWKYRESLPKDLPDETVAELLEEKYREIYKPVPGQAKRRMEYPTPASAVGLRRS